SAGISTAWVSFAISNSFGHLRAARLSDFPGSVYGPSIHLANRVVHPKPARKGRFPFPLGAVRARTSACRFAHIRGCCLPALRLRVNRVPPSRAAREGQRTGEPNALADACPRPGTDRTGPAPIQETAGAQRDPEGAPEAQVLREALRGPPPGRAPQAERHPQGQEP